MKKRYLQLRVKRAAQAAKLLSCEERTRLLEHKRAELLKRIADASTTIAELEIRMEAQLKDGTLAQCLREKLLSNLITASSNLRNECTALLATDPLLTAPTPNYKRSASLEALMQEYISQGRGDDPLHHFTDRKTMEIIMEINDRLRDMKQTLLGGSLAPVPLDAQELNKLRNIQQVALELARCIIIARTRPEGVNEMRERVKLLRKETSINCTSSLEGILELSLYNQLRAEGLSLRILTETARQQVVNTTEQVIRMNHAFGDQTGRLRQLCENLQKALLNHTTSITKLLRPAEPCSHDGYENLLYIKTKHALAATILPNVQDCLDKIEVLDAPLVSRLGATLSQITVTRDEAKRRFGAFEAECHAIERLRGREDARQLLNSVVTK